MVKKSASGRHLSRQLHHQWRTSQVNSNVLTGRRDLPSFWFLCYLDFSAMRSLSTAAAGHSIKMRKNHWAARLCTLIPSCAILKAERKLKMKIRSKESITYDFISSCKLGWLCDASGEFVIEMRLIICEEIGRVVHRFREAIIDSVDKRQLLVAAAFAFLLTINLWFTLDPGISQYTVVGMSIMLRAIIFIPLRFWTELYSTLGDFSEFECRLTSIFSHLMWQRFERRFHDFLRGSSLLPESERLGNDSPTSLYVSAVSIRSLDANAVLLFICSIQLPVLRLTNFGIGAMKELEVNNLFSSLSPAALVSNRFDMWPSNVSPMTSLRSRSNMTSSTTLYTSDQRLLCVIWYDRLIYRSATLWP